MAYLIDWEGNRLSLSGTQNSKSLEQISSSTTRGGEQALWQRESNIYNSLASFVGGNFSKRDFDIAKHFFELGLKAKGE